MLNLYMRLLMYSKQQDELKEFYHIVNKLSKHFDIDTASTIDEAINLYSKNTYDVIIIDYIKDEKELQTYILEKNPKQNITILSNNLSCTEPMGCDYCIENHNIKRLLKPLKAKDIINILDTETKCIKYCKDKFQMKLYMIEKYIDHSSSYIFDKNQLKFTKNKYISGTENIFLEIISKLKSLHIPFYVDSNYDIVIIDKNK